MELPKSGETVVLENGDSQDITDRTVFRVHTAEVQPHDFGMVTLYGWPIGSDGFPATTEKRIRVMNTTLDARRVHRRDSR